MVSKLLGFGWGVTLLLSLDLCCAIMISVYRLPVCHYIQIIFSSLDVSSPASLVTFAGPSVPLVCTYQRWRHQQAQWLCPQQSDGFLWGDQISGHPPLWPVSQENVSLYQRYQDLQLWSGLGVWGLCAVQGVHRLCQMHARIARQEASLPWRGQGMECDH